MLAPWRNLRTPLGCDTFVAFPPSSPKGTVIFGKNSDRPQGESQFIRHYPAQDYKAGDSLKCTYIQIPQAVHTHEVLLSQIDWMWGVEHGVNEHGVAIGNEAVWTKVSDEPLEIKRLLGMDLVRLGLERGSTAKESLDVITNLLETHGQGGPCAENDESFTYHNSFLIVDRTEAWVLETAGRHWVAERNVGNRNISNTLTIRTSYDLSSKGLEDYAKQNGLWNGAGSLDWALCFGESAVEECHSPDSRQTCGGKLLNQYKDGTLDHDAMKEILRDHTGGICMHGGFETTASMVCELRSDGTVTNWVVDRPHPCRHDYKQSEGFNANQAQTSST